MDKKGTIIISIAILLGFLLIGLLIRAPLEKINNSISKEDNRYQMISPNDNNIIIFDTETGEYWRKFIQPNAGPTEWTKEINPKLND